jgi:hypothetical protein
MACGALASRIGTGMSPTTTTVLLTGATLLAIGVLILVVWLVRRHLGIGSSGAAVSSSGVGRLLDAQGAGRAMEAIVVLRDLATRSNPDEVATVWFRIAPAIESALPQCPPAVRNALHQALTQAAATCPSKAVAKAMSNCAELCR